MMTRKRIYEIIEKSEGDDKLSANAKKAMDRYVDALTAVERQIYAFSDAYNNHEEGLTAEAFREICDGIVTSSLKNLEADLRREMTAYLDHASNHGKKKIEKVDKSAGAARYAGAKGILEFLNTAETVQARKADVLRDNVVPPANEARIKETSYQKLFKEHLDKADGTARERRIRAAELAQQDMKANNWRAAQNLH